MKTVSASVTAVIGLLALVSCSDSKEVQQVKGGTLQICPNHTVDSMVKNFMGSPTWQSGRTEGGQIFVNVDGDIRYQDTAVRAKLQFFIDGESFSFNAIEMNGVPTANIIAVGMMQKMCEGVGGA